MGPFTANIISRLPIIPFVGKEVKKEFKTKVKMESGKSEPVATMTTTTTTPVQMSTLEATIPSEQGRPAADRPHPEFCQWLSWILYPREKLK